VRFPTTHSFGCGTRWRGGALEAIFTDASLRDLVRSRDAKDGTHREENLDQLMAMATSFTSPNAVLDGLDADPLTVTEDFLEMLSLASSEDDSDDDGPSDRVQILTMHSAKGKEFDHVYVIGCEEQVLPHSRAIDEGPVEIEEERRLFFVAASRARKTLSLSWCAQRMRFGKVEQSLPSRFLDDVARHLLEVTDPPPVQWPSAGGRGQGSSWGSRGSYGGSHGGRANSGSSRRNGGSTRPGAYRTAPTNPAPSSRPAKAQKVAVATVNAAQLETSSRVRHAKFGDGDVLEVAGETARIHFDTVGEKNLLLTVAPLQLV
jgi:DNA helicase-2/ATP-dependent DNA helicase PcrA